MPETDIFEVMSTMPSGVCVSPRVGKSRDRGQPRPHVSSLTRCWREMDSNPPVPLAKSRVFGLSLRGIR